MVGFRLVVCGLAAVLAGGAWARQPPRPPDSGITVHPFGAPGMRPVQVPVLLRRMFVTGDPAQRPGQALAHGRAELTTKRPPNP